MAIEPKDIVNGKMYWHQLTYRNGTKFGSLVEKATTQEIDPPFRYGVGLAIRLPFTNKAVVIGAWIKTQESESMALTYAIKGRYVPGSEVDWDYIRYEDQRAEDVKAEIETGTKEN
jgi:hypothetical protein